MACDLTIGDAEEGVDTLLVPGERERERRRERDEKKRRGEGGETDIQTKPRVMIVSVSD